MRRATNLRPSVYQFSQDRKEGHRIPLGLFQFFEFKFRPQQQQQQQKSSLKSQLLRISPTTTNAISNTENPNLAVNPLWFLVRTL